MSEERRTLEDLDEYRDLPKQVQHQLADKQMRNISETDISIAVRKGLRLRSQHNRRRNVHPADFVHNMRAGEIQALLEGARRYLFGMEDMYVPKNTNGERKIQMDL